MAGAQEHIVHIPLVGIELHDERLPIGKVVLKKMAGAHLDELSQRVEAAMQQAPGTPEEQVQLVEMQLPRILASFKETLCAEIRIEAEPELAKEHAEAEARRVLDLIRYAIPSLYPGQLDIAVGIQGEVSPAARSRVTLAISSDGDTSTWQWQAGQASPPFALSPENIAGMTHLGVFEVAKILEKPEQQWSDFEHTLLAGIHWFANAQTEFEPAYRLLSLITCLETFLTPQDGNPIGTAIAEGVAIIIGPDLETRKALKKKIQKLYSMRSAVTHGGRKDVVEQDIGELRGLAQELIGWMVLHRDQFTDRDALLDWILEQKLAPAGKPG